MSAINAHILPAIGHVRLVATDETTLNNVINHVVNSGSGSDNCDSVLQTLSVVSIWGMSRMNGADGCFGSDKSVSAAKKDGKRRTATPQNSNDGDGDHGIPMEFSWEPFRLHSEMKCSSCQQPCSTQGHGAPKMMTGFFSIWVSETQQYEKHVPNSRPTVAFYRSFLTGGSDPALR